MTELSKCPPQSMRLSRRVAELFSCSRSVAEMYIEGGWVQVAGQVVEEPQFKVNDEHIELASAAQAVAPALVTLLAHKPAGINATALLEHPAQWFDPARRSPLDSTATRPLKRHLRSLQAASMLDEFASGLIVLTQDAGVLRKLRPAQGVPEQEYLIDLCHEITLEAVTRLQLPDTSGPYRRPTIKVSRQSEAHLRMVGKGLDSASINQICSHAQIEIVAIRRIRIGSVSMGKMVSGEWRYLGEKERF